jgi:hypothetical protein
MGGWMGGWMDVKAVLRIAYSNQKNLIFVQIAKSNQVRTREYLYGSTSTLASLSMVLVPHSQSSLEFVT